MQCRQSLQLLNVKLLVHHVTSKLERVKQTVFAVSVERIIIRNFSRLVAAVLLTIKEKRE